MPRSDVDTFTTETSRPITARNSSLPTEFARQSFASQRFVALYHYIMDSDINFYFSDFENTFSNYKPGYFSDFENTFSNYKPGKHLINHPQEL